MAKLLLIDYTGTRFLRTSQTTAHPNRLNAQANVILRQNVDAIEGKRVLDLASHDGRFSYACLQLGAREVVGVEARAHLVKAATENLTYYGYEERDFHFFQADVFDYLPEVNPGDFDTVLCLGFFYHTVRQVELIQEMRRISPRYLVLDTEVLRGTFVTCPPAVVKAWPPDAAGGPVARFLRGAWRTLKYKLMYCAKCAAIARRPACLVFRYEDPCSEGATIASSGLMADPTVAVIEQLLDAHGFRFSRIQWSCQGITDWHGLEDYRAGERVSYVVESCKS
jgi:SAM-dependent methyltransferase